MKLVPMKATAEVNVAINYKPDIKETTKESSIKKAIKKVFNGRCKTERPDRG